MEKKRYTNKEIVKMLKEVLAAMEVKNYFIFRVRAYQNAIAVLDNLTVSIYDMWEKDKLKEIPGIGEGIAEHLNDLFTAGTSKEFETAKKSLPEGMFALIGLRGIGAKKAFKLATAFKLTDRETAVEHIKTQAEKGMIKVLEGFGDKSEKDILDAIDQAKMTKNEKQRMLLARAEVIVDRVTQYMQKLPEVLQIEATGSFRRKNPTIGDLDFIVATNEPEKVIDHFLKFPEIGEVLVKGEKKASVNLKSDVQVDIRVSTSKAYGAMLQYSTGSKQHNILLRNFALEKGMSLSEYGIKEDSKLLEFSNEEAFYDHLGLQSIPPEIRSGSDEIEVALKHKIPQLVELKDIKGDLHTHTKDSDGANSLEEMVEAAAANGFDYLGVTDHAPSILNRGYDEVKKLIDEKRDLIDKYNAKQNKIKVLFGYEVNILADATLAMSDDLLRLLDFAIASIHTSFNQEKDVITKRFISAIENPYVTIIGHPVGRLINQRDAVEADWNKIFDAAIANNKILEINSQPDRLDLTDDLVKEAVKKGVKLVIDTDSHAIEQFSFMRGGIYVARRGWATKENIINTLPFSEFIQQLSRFRK
jgi:DNA polymerase (family X)